MNNSRQCHKGRVDAKEEGPEEGHYDEGRVGDAESLGRHQRTRDQAQKADQAEGHDELTDTHCMLFFLTHVHI